MICDFAMQPPYISECMCVCSNLVYVSIGCVFDKFDFNSRASDMISRDFRCTCIRFIMFGCSSRCIIHVCVGCMFICDVANIWMHIYIYIFFFCSSASYDESPSQAVYQAPEGWFGCADEAHQCARH